MNGGFSEKRVTVAASIATAVILLMVLVYVFSGSLGEETVQVVIGLGDILAAGTCTALAFILWRSFERRELLKQVWLDLGIGLAMWTIAELIYDINGLTSTQALKSPTLADAIWLPGFIPIFLAFWLRYRSLRVGLTRRQMVVLVLGFAALAMLSLGFVLVPNIDRGNPGALGLLTLGVLYGIGDLLLAMAVGLTIVSLLGGQLSRSWMLVALGFLSIAAGDSMYYSGVATGWYASAAPINLFSAVCDITYWAGYVIIAVGLYDQAVLQRAV